MLRRSAINFDKYVFATDYELSCQWALLSRLFLFHFVLEGGFYAIFTAVILNYLWSWNIQFIETRFEQTNSINAPYIPIDEYIFFNTE